MKNIKQALKQSTVVLYIYKYARKIIYNLYKVIGYQPCLPQANQSYWESRGEKYIEEVKSIYTNPEDPYCLAQSEVIETLAEVPWKSLLEVGCGFGFYLEALKRTFPERLIVGIDFSHSNLVNGKHYLENRGCDALMAQADAFNLPFTDASYDLVITSGLIIYIHPKNIPLFINEIKRVSNGHFLFVEYAKEHNQAHDNWEIPFYLHNYSEICSHHGLVIKKSKPFDAFIDVERRITLSLILACDTAIHAENNG